MKTLPSLPHPGRTLFMVGLAAGLNLLPLQLPGDVWFFLGPFAYMPLVLALPLPWSVLAAAVPAICTLPVVGHPLAFVVATLEAAWLVFARQKIRRSALLHDGLFWLLASVPLFVGLAYFAGRMPGDLVVFTAGKQIFNQMTAVGIAAFLLRHTSLPAWLLDRPLQRRRMRGTVFYSVFILATVPLALAGIGVSMLLRAYSDRDDREVLGVTAHRLGQQLDLFLHSHEAAVSSLARTLSRSPHDGTILLEEVRRAHPSFIAIRITDASGANTHAAPADLLARTDFARIGETESFRCARESNAIHVSGVLRRRDFDRDTFVAISAPLHDARGNFAGIVEAALDVQHFARGIAAKSPEGVIELIFADAAGRIIFAEEATGLQPLFSLRNHALNRLLAPDRADSPAQFTRLSRGGHDERYTAVATRVARSGVWVIAQRPLLAAYEGAGWIFGLFGGVAVATLAAAGWIARSAHEQMSAPLERFSESANRLATLRTVEPITGDHAKAPYEVWTVYRAFNQLAVQLQGSYAMLRQTNADLDRRVIERTAEAETARAQAEAASQSKSDFLAMTSHEIRTPLNAIIGLAGSLIDNAGESLAQQRLRTIHTSGQRLLSVVNDLLDLSKVEAGKLELRPEPTELGALCADLERLFALRAKQQGVRFEIARDDNDPFWFEADGTRLQQILINLVGNALKFTPAGGRVCLRVTRESGSGAEVPLRFSVSDTGPGIPREQQALLFQPFVQLPGAAQSSTPGSGLGLSISRRLVQLFGGQLAVNSETGRGSEFHFTIVVPRAAAPPIEASPPPVSADVPGPELRVLAADDNIANQEVLRSLLERRCATLVIVDGAEAAIAELERAEFDVALIDLEMPETDGFTVARTVRAWSGAERSRGCRLVAFSAHDRRQMWRRCAASGFDDFVEKPIDRRELWRALQKSSAAEPAAPTV